MKPNGLIAHVLPSRSRGCVMPESARTRIPAGLFWMMLATIKTLAPCWTAGIIATGATKPNIARPEPTSCTVEADPWPSWISTSSPAFS